MGLTARGFSRLILSCLLVAWCMGCGQPKPVTSQELFEAIAESQPSTANSKEHERGRELSKSVCAGCHLYPEPDLLDKFTWAFETLPNMAFYVGYDPLDPDSEPGGHRIRDAKIIPEQPLIPYEDWRAICNYYIAAAPESPIAQGSRPKIALGVPQFKVELLRNTGPPAVTLVKIDDRTGDIFLGNAAEKNLRIISATGVLRGSLPLDSPPVDIAQGSDGFYASLIGSFVPSDDPLGQVVHLGDPARGAPEFNEALAKLQRPSSIAIADLNEDGREDIVVAEFGYILGNLRWYENLGGGKYAPRELLERSGAVKVAVEDFNSDGKPDILAMMAHGREGIHLFLNEGKGQFTPVPVIERHPAWGYSQFSLADFNADGLPDILACAGDNGDNLKYRPPLKRDHGVRVHLNQGGGKFTEAMFSPLNGAYRAIAEDFDADGDLDIAAISYFPDYDKSPQESFVYLENQGDLKFSAASMPESLAGRWITLDTGDVDKDGDIDIVLGSYADGPGSVPTPLIEKWNRENTSLLILRNTLKP